MPEMREALRSQATDAEIDEIFDAIDVDKKYVSALSNRRAMCCSCSAGDHCFWPPRLCPVSHPARARSRLLLHCRAPRAAVVASSTLSFWQRGWTRHCIRHRTWLRKRLHGLTWSELGASRAPTWPYCLAASTTWSWCATQLQCCAAEWQPHCCRWQTEEMINEADADGDGVVCLDEFRAMLAASPRALPTPVPPVPMAGGPTHRWSRVHLERAISAQDCATPIHAV